MSYNPELVEKVFKPGNLVHGANIDDFVATVIQGIKSPVGAFGEDEAHRLKTSSPENICFALLSNDQMPKRYVSAWHEGPYGFLDAQSLAYVVNGQKTQELLRGEVFAVGNNFQGMMNSQRSRYCYNSETHSVFGIPILDHGFSSDFYVDEVRIYPNDHGNTTITPHTWDGIMVRENIIPKLRCIPLKLIDLPKIPVFTEGFEVVTEDWREVIAA